MGLVLVLAAFTASAASPAVDLRVHNVVMLRRGMNQVDLGVPGRPATVVIGRRENFNAHGFDVVTAYLPGTHPSELDIVGRWDGKEESDFLNVGGGADCVLNDFRLLRPPAGQPRLLVVAGGPRPRVFQVLPAHSERPAGDYAAPNVEDQSK